jgi:hypothetical protein
MDEGQKKETMLRSWMQWLMPVILATLEDWKDHQFQQESISTHSRAWLHTLIIPVTAGNIK